MEAAIVSIRCSREGPVDDACCIVLCSACYWDSSCQHLSCVFFALQERGVARTFNNTDLVLPALKAGVALLDRWGEALLQLNTARQQAVWIGPPRS